MNDKVDTRVVRMEFDNKQFEKNIKQTSKSLENLKQNLNFDGIGDGLDKVKLKISALNVATTTFIVNLTNKVINLGTTLVKSLSVDNIAAGWDKFGEKTISVATMMAQKIRIAGREIEDYAEKTSVVNEQLERLVWFSDETSYSFTDMVKYAGQFIAAGQDLDKSVKAMEGIATWAAMSGQNAQKASIAMLQLSQAMGRAINNQDWMSIKNAGMDTEIFREKVLETAVALGQLTKEGDKFVTKTGKKFDKSGFTKFFSEGWFTSDVLIETLNKYSAAVDEVYRISTETGLTATEVMEKYADQLDEFGLAALKASQEARTFTDVINSIKDAVSSKWMQTFEFIFGNNDESIKLWSELANQLYDVFAESGNFRNDILSIWKTLNGREDIFGEHGSANQGAFWNIYDALIAIRDLISDAWNTIFPVSEMEDESDKAKDIGRNLKGITNSLRILTEQIKYTFQNSIVLRNVFESIFKVIRLGLVAILGIKYALEPIFYTLKQLTTQILSRTANLIGGIDELLTHVVSISTRLNSALWDIIEIINPSYILNSVFTTLQRIMGIISEFNPIGRLINFVDELFRGIREGGGTQENFIKITKGLLSLVNILTKAILAITAAISKYLLPILDKIINVAGYLTGLLTGFAIHVIALISDVIIAISNFFDGIEDASKVGNSVKDFFNYIPKALEVILPLLKSLVGILKAAIDLILLLPKALDALSRRLTGKGIVDNLTEFFEKVSTTIQNFINGIDIKVNGGVGSFGGLLNGLIAFFDGLREILKGLLASIQATLVVLGAAFKTLGKLLQKFANVVIQVFSGNYKDLAESTKRILNTIIVLGSLVLISYMLYSVFYRIMAAINPVGSVIESICDILDSWRLDTLTRKLSSITRSLLKIGIAVTLMDRVSDNFKDWIIIFIGVFGFFAITGFYISEITGSVLEYKKKMSQAETAVKDASGQTNKTNSTVKSFVKILNALANVMLSLAVIALIFGKIEETQRSEVFNMVVGLFAMVALVASALVIVLTSTNKKFDELNGIQRKTIGSGNSIVKNMLGLSVLLTAFSLALGTLVASILVLNKIISGNEAGWKALIAPFVIISLLIGQMMAAMIVLSNKTGFQDLKSAASTILMLGAIVTSIAVLAKVFEKLAAIDKNQLWAAFWVISLLFEQMVGALLLISNIRANTKRTIQTIAKLGALTTVMLSFSIGIIAFAHAMNILAKVDLLKAGAGLGVAVAALAGLVLVAKKASSVLPSFIAISSALVLVGSSVLMAGLGIKYMAEAIDLLIAKRDGIIQFLSILGKGIGEFLGGLITGLGSVINAIINVIFSAVKLILNGIISILIDYSLPLAKAITDSIIQVLQYVVSVQNTIFEVLGQLIRGSLEFVFNFLIANSDWILDMTVQLVHVLISNLAKNLPQMLDDINTLIFAFIETIIDALPPIVEKFVGVIVKLIVNVWNGIMKAFGADQLGITEDQFKDFFSKIADIIVGFISTLKKVYQAFKPVIELVASLIQIILPPLLVLLEPILQILGIINKGIAYILLSITEFFNNNIIGPILGWITNELSKFADYLNRVIGPMQTILKLVFQDFIPAMKALISGDMKSFGDIIKNNIANLRSYFDSLGEDLTKEVLTFMRVVGGILTGGLSELVILIATNANKITNFIKSFGDGIKKRFEQFKSFFTQTIPNFFKDIWNGIKEGLTKGWETCKNTVKSVSNNIIDYFKNLFGIHSPSTVMANIGNYMMQGLASGLEEGAQEEKSTFNSVFKDLVGTLNDLLNSDDDFTIKVGMDISAVESQTRNIRSLMSSVSNYDVSGVGAYQANAFKAANEIARDKNASSKTSTVGSQEVYNDNTTNNNVFNIKSSNPKEAADEIDKILQEKARQKKLAHGGI